VSLATNDVPASSTSLVYFPLNSTEANRSEDERGAKRGEAVKVPSTYVILTSASGNAPAEMQLCCILVKLFAKLEKNQQPRAN
jgi:hypothetical protein